MAPDIATKHNFMQLTLTRAERSFITLTRGRKVIHYLDEGQKGHYLDEGQKGHYLDEGQKGHYLDEGQKCHGDVDESVEVDVSDGLVVGNAEPLGGSGGTVHPRIVQHPPQRCTKQRMKLIH